MRSHKIKCMNAKDLNDLKDLNSMNHPKNCSKKSQITLFLILGLLILIFTGIFIYLRMQSGIDKGELAIAQEVVSSEVKSVQTYFTQCVEDISKEGLIKLGLNGGYIDPQNTQYTFGNLKQDDGNPTESDMVSIPGMNTVPYWYYMPTPNNCQMDECNTSYNFPLIEDVQSQLSLYVGDNIGKCVELFGTVAENQGYTVSPKQIPVTSTKINNNDISVLVYYPIEVSKEGRQYTLNYFYVKHPLDFGKVYTTALLLSHSEGTNRYLEKIFKLVLSNYQGTSFESLPPFYKETLGPIAVSWSPDLVQLRLMDILNAYIPLIRVQNSDNGMVYTSESKVLNNIYEYSMITNPYNFSNMEIRYYYLNWPIYMDITPKTKDGMLKPDVEETEVPMSTTTIKNKYHFKYDIAFPVIVEVRDKTAFSGQGYSLFFALEGNIKNNEDIFSYMLQYPINPPLPDDMFTIEGYDSESLDTVTVPASSTYPEDTFNDPYAPIPEGTTQTVKKPSFPSDNTFCDPEQRLGPEVLFKVTDAQTGEPIKESVIFYKCGPFYTCRLAATDEKGLAASKVPLCEKGAFKFETYPYTNYYYPYDSKITQKKDAVSVEMYKPFEKKFKFKMINVYDLETYGAEDEDNIDNPTYAYNFKREYAYEEFGSNSTVMLMINRKDQNAYSDSFVRSYNINNLGSKLEGMMELIPAEYGTGAGYDVKIIYINNSLHVAKGSGLFNGCCHKVEGDEEGDEECYYSPPATAPIPPETPASVAPCPEEDKRFEPYNPVVINGTMQGMADINEKSTTYLWHINYEDLIDPEKDTIVFYILKISLPEYTKDLQEMTEVQKKSSKFRQFIVPEILSSQDIQTQFIAPPLIGPGPAVTS